MAKKLKPKPDDAKQSQRFVETAKALEVDKSGKSFERVLNTIANKKRGKDSKH